MDKALILAKELKALRERVSSIVAIPTPLDGLDGPRGLSGKDGRQGEEGGRGKDGRDGKDGEDGKQGDDGEDGVSVVDAYTAADRSLVFVLSDGREIDTGAPLATDSSNILISTTNPQPRTIQGIAGTAVLDFGDGSTEAEVVVTGITEVLSTSVILATTRIEATVDHSEDDLLIDPIRTVVKSLVVGEGFTIYGAMDNARTNGLYKVDWFLSN